MVALPEARQLDVLAGLLERRGAEVVRCPLVSIHDAPDAAPVTAWIQRFIAEPMDLFVIYTGEGIERLLGFAEREGVREGFVAALTRTRKLARGPKPGRVLKRLGLHPELQASVPTTEGVIHTLRGLELGKGRLGVQLYGTEANEPLMAYLASRGVQPDCVAPYVYAPAADDARVAALIERMRAGGVDAIAFTSKSQVERLRRFARRGGLEEALSGALEKMTVAAIGPVVAEELRDTGVRVDVMPQRTYFMKPLVSELSTALGLDGFGK